MNRVFFSVLTPAVIAILFSGCVSDRESELEENRGLVRQFIAETDAQDFASYDQLLADDVIVHFPNGVEMDRHTAEENERVFAVAFPDASRSIDQLIAEGDRVVLRETLRGTHNGPFGDIQASGTSIDVTANIIYRIADQRIAEIWVEADLGTFMSQIAGASATNDLSNVDYQAIQAQTAAWIEGAAAGDLDGYFDFITEDFIWLGDYTGPGFSGHESVREFLEPFFGSYVFSIEDVQSNGVVFSADGGSAIHRYSGTAGIESKETGEITRYKRKYVDFWRRGDDGVWRCSRHLYVVID